MRGCDFITIPINLKFEELPLAAFNLLKCAAEERNRFLHTPSLMIVSTNMFDVSTKIKLLSTDCLDDNSVIYISNNTHDHFFVCVKQHDMYGLAILNTDKVLIVTLPLD